MVDQEELSVVVLDVGTGVSKCGFGGDEAPRSIFPTIVGRPRVPGIMVGMDQKDAYAGPEAIEKEGMLTIKRPIEKRQIVDWDDIEKVWHYAYYQELQVAPEEHPVLLSETPKCPEKSRERTMEIMFEVFTVPAYYTVVQAALGLFASGKTIGLVVDSGEGATHTVPVYEGYCCPNAVNQVSVAGGELTTYYQKLLHDRGYSFSTTEELKVVKDIKEKLSYVARNYQDELNSYEETAHCDQFYELPDGNTLLATSERFRGPEALFDPTMCGYNEDGIHHRVYQSIMKCDQEIRKELYDNILLVGGTTLISGLGERLRAQVQGLAPVGTRPKVNEPPERQYTVWIGGSVMASLSTFQNMWISKAQYEEHGSRIIHIKC